MTFNRVNGGGWALYETLTSAQMNALDINMTYALDGNGGGDYSPSSALKVHGKILGENVATRTFLLPLFAAGCPQRSGSDAEAEWRPEFDGSKHWWESMTDSAQRLIQFDLNRFVPSECTITRIRARVNPSATQATEADRMRLRLVDSDNVGENITVRQTAYYPNSGSHVEAWIDTGTISQAIDASTYMHWIEIQSSNATQNDLIISIEITYAEGDYQRLP